MTVSREVLRDMNEQLYAALKQVVEGLDAEFGQRVTDVNFPLARPALANSQSQPKPIPRSSFV